jgi:hypothetical protein
LECHVLPLHRLDAMMVTDLNLFEVANTFLDFLLYLDAINYAWILLTSSSTSCTTCVYYVWQLVQAFKLRIRAVVCYGLCQKRNYWFFCLVFKRYALIIVNLEHLGKSQLTLCSSAMHSSSKINKFVQFVEVKYVPLLALLTSLYRATSKTAMQNSHFVLLLLNLILQHYVPNGTTDHRRLLNSEKWLFQQ